MFNKILKLAFLALFALSINNSFAAATGSDDELLPRDAAIVLGVDFIVHDLPIPTLVTYDDELALAVAQEAIANIDVLHGRMLRLVMPRTLKIQILNIIKKRDQEKYIADFEAFRQKSLEEKGEWIEDIDLSIVDNKEMAQIALQSYLEPKGIDLDPGDIEIILGLVRNHEAENQYFIDKINYEAERFLSAAKTEATDTALRVCPAGHLVHDHCFKDMEAAGDTKCPVCRSDGGMAKYRPGMRVIHEHGDECPVCIEELVLPDAGGASGGRGDEEKRDLDIDNQAEVEAAEKLEILYARWAQNIIRDWSNVKNIDTSAMIEIINKIEKKLDELNDETITVLSKNLFNIDSLATPKENKDTFISILNFTKRMVESGAKL